MPVAVERDPGDRHRIVSNPSGPFSVTDSWSMSTARVLSRISTPIFSSVRWAYCCSFGGNGPSTAPIPSTSMMRASRVSTDR